MTIYVNDFLNSLGMIDIVQAIRDGAGSEKVELINCNRALKNIQVSKDDTLIIWNRHLNQDQIAKKFEEAGATVLLFENPYIDVNQEETWFSVGLGYHNTLDYSIPCQDSGERFDSFNIDIKEWNKNESGHIVVATQAKTFDGAGLGMKELQQPHGWDSSTLNTLAKNDREVVFRTHPKSRNPQIPHGLPYHISYGSKTDLSHDLKDAYCVVVHTSNTATHALLNGVPVFYTGSNIFMKDCCSYGLNDLETRRNFSNKRKKVLDIMAWNQYNIEELKNGMLFEIIKRLK